MKNPSTTGDDTVRIPSRRSVLTATAWSLPVIATAVAAPAQAGSTPPCPEPSPAAGVFIDLHKVTTFPGGKYQSMMQWGNRAWATNGNELLAPVAVQTDGTPRLYVISKVSWEVANATLASYTVSVQSNSNPSAWKVVDHGWNTTSGSWPGQNVHSYTIENVNPSAPTLSVPRNTAPDYSSPNNPFPSVQVVFGGASSSQFWTMDGGQVTTTYYFLDVPAGCEGSSTHPFTHVHAGPSW